jgi:outer membrane lipoprotein-sorting protein
MDSRTLQKGKFYFQKEKKRSMIRINFDKRKQDNEDEYTNIQQIIFDGVWLIRIDHEMETVIYDQQAEKNKPIEAFEFISRNFPMIGFTKTEELQKNFDIKMLENDNDPNTPIHLHLKPKAGSKYVKEYSQLNFWIDKKSFLPSRLITTEFAEIEGEGNIYDIKMNEIKANKKIEKAVFKVETPAGFTEDRRLLEDKRKK